MPGGCFLSRGGMFFLAGVVAGRSSAPMCDCIARPIFGFLPLGATFGACLLLRSLVGRLEASGMCSLDQHEEGGFSDVRFEPLNRFEPFKHPKCRKSPKKHAEHFQNPIISV